MTSARIEMIIKQGEGPAVGFKECKSSLNKSVYETVCAFLNKQGGEILLGVKDNGTINGIDPAQLEQIKKDFVTTINNPGKITPPVYLSIEELIIDGRHILYVYIPKSSQVHKCDGKIFIRNNDSDLDITRKPNLITRMYAEKQSAYSENRIYPYCDLADLRPDLIERARKYAGFHRNNHPWNELSDEEILKSVKLHGKDFQSGKSGYTLAAILLFGKDETIISVVPHHKTDLLLRKVNLDRYDDRDDVRTNLLDSYDRINAFGQKHLSDPFYIEGTQRVSVRDMIFREISSNILMHREYMDPFPAKIIIESNRIYSENSNRPHNYGPIDLDNFTPFPKNPLIARVFKEIGFADELGSGVRNLYKYTGIYSNSEPQLIEEDVFKLIIPLSEQAETVNEPLNETVNETVKILLKAMEENPQITWEDMKHLTGKSRATVARHISALKEAGFIDRQGSDKKGYWIIKKDQSNERS